MLCVEMMLGCYVDYSVDAMLICCHGDTLLMLYDGMIFLLMLRGCYGWILFMVMMLVFESDGMTTVM